MANHFEILIPTDNASQMEILIAQLAEMGFEGFEEEETQLHAFVKDDEFREEEFMRLLKKIGLGYEKKLLTEQNWNESWEKNFNPVRIGNFCVVRSSFHKPDQNTLFEIIITPKMSFGTGHHATTFMMIEAMQKLKIKGKKVLDFGTGTGILAILAEKMGAESVYAFDLDDWSIANAMENLSENGCKRIRLGKRSEIPDETDFDLILANINKYVIFNSLQEMQQQLNEDGVVLLSGILTDDLLELNTIMAQHNLRLEESKEMENWICARLRKIVRN
jgi:ribosomal protein L11 methyltransferase